MKRDGNAAARRRCTLLAVLALLAGGAQAQEPAGPAYDVALGAKLSGYIDCINGHSNAVLDSRDRYYSWLKSPKAGPTGREAVVYGVYALQDPSACVARIDRAEALEPELPDLEQAARAWVQALVAARLVVAEANDYYELENYRDDAMRAGKALHPRLVQAYGAFGSANTRFYDAVASVKEAMDQRLLQRLAEDPQQRPAFLVEQAGDRARRMLRSAQPSSQEDFQTDAFAAAVAEYERAWRELDAWNDAHPAEGLDSVHVSLYLDAGFELLKAAKALLRRARGEFRFDTGERMLIDAHAAQMVEGHPDHLLDAYNGFVDAGNR